MTTEMNMDEKKAQASKNPLKKWAAPIILLVGLVAFFALGLDQYISFQALKENRVWLLEQVENQYWLTALVFMVIYGLCIVFSLPIASVISISGGFLFGAVAGASFIVISATLGATALFLVARSALGDSFKAKTGKWVSKMEAGFQENELSYMLVLRLVPLFPFFVVNLVPAFLNVSVRNYVLGTFFGIIPGAFVFALVGEGLGSVFDRGEDFTPAGILTPEIIAAFVGLAILAMIPVVYKKIKARKA